MKDFDNWNTLKKKTENKVRELISTFTNLFNF